VALCIDRGVRRFEKATILFDRPATTIAFPCNNARIPLAATGRGFMVRRRSKADVVAPAASSKPVAVCPYAKSGWLTTCDSVTAPGERRPFHTFAVRSSSGSRFGAALQAR